MLLSPRVSETRNCDVTIRSSLKARIISKAGVFLALIVFVVSARAADNTSPNLERGTEIYFQTCVACHGEDGKGAIPGILDFTEPGRLTSQSQDLLVHHIVDGVQSSGSPIPMPANGGNPSLTEQDALDVLAYIEDTFAR